MFGFLEKVVSGVAQVGIDTVGGAIDIAESAVDLGAAVVQDGIALVKTLANEVKEATE